MRNKQPRISVIIPAYNEQGYIEDCLESLDKQTFRDFETIVIDSGHDNTSRIARKHKTKVIKYVKNGPAAARNIGAENSRGDILVFADADCRFDADFLHRINQKFEKPIGGGICQLSVYDYDRKSDAIMYEMINTITKALIAMRFIVTSGSCFVYDRKAFFNAKGFNAKLYTNEDHDLARRVGKQKRFEVFDNITVQTSSRRLKKWGIFKTARIYTKSALLYFLSNKPLMEYWDNI
ncbi:MAG: glycosyltransferase [Candidatus Aenigmarchaeota archaeon]|nr:glycosyltransferase [Candidatus Aenigmarchaeota archaeon]